MPSNAAVKGAYHFCGKDNRQAHINTRVARTRLLFRCPAVYGDMGCSKKKALS
jgi:hypothetical protein